MIISEEQWRQWKFPGSDGWTNWSQFTEVVIGRASTQAGVYVLGVPANSKGESRIGRLLGDDPNGILDIGESEYLRARLSALYNCVSTPGQRGHMAGWRLGTFGLLGRLKLNVSDLRISWCSATSKADAYRIEGELLRAYYELFGELPPLNYKFNWTTWEDT